MGTIQHTKKYVNKSVIPEFFYRGYGFRINTGFPITPSGVTTFGRYRKNKLDREAFSKVFPFMVRYRTLLISPNDRAVFLSRCKHQHDRVGYAPPVTIMEGIETIKVDGFGLLDLGHCYFASAGPVIRDISEAIETGRAAGKRKIPQAFEYHFVIDIRQQGRDSSRPDSSAHQSYRYIPLSVATPKPGAINFAPTMRAPTEDDNLLDLDCRTMYNFDYCNMYNEVLYEAGNLLRTAKSCQTIF